MRLFLLLLPAFALAANGVCGQQLIKPTNSRQPVDTAIYVVLHYNDRAKLGMNGYYRDTRPDTLTPAEVDNLEPLIDSAYWAYTKASPVYLHDLLPLPLYRRQYVAVVNWSDEREVWVNFFCAGFGYGRRAVIVVDDR